jgi:hypothetical protein
MKLQNSLVSILLFVSSSIAVAKDEQCPFPDIYIEFDRSYHQCINGQVRKGESCDRFVENIVKLFPRYDCKRSFDTAPVPAIWLFDAAMEDYIKLLYELASSKNKTFDGQWFEKEKTKARAIFLSPEFRAVLDGHMAEEYYPLIERVRKNAP